ncbi:glycosyltransferase [Celerinatantimonas sp. YJH-8]|uniref:glycosyltransferase n=1 Tax=Celerinatantimonas sp. YJH-8 TaxID=3228714 RepID=UPI0038C9AF29
MISVIVVTFNNKEGLRLTLKSIIYFLHHHNCSNVEVIIKDGGSTDDTKEFIDWFYKCYPTISNTIRFISSNDTGIYDAMNQAIEYCSGDHVIFMNAGDAFYTNSLSLILSNQLDSNIIYYGDAIFYDDRNRFEKIYKIDSVSCFLKHNPFNHQAILYPRKCFNAKTNYNTNLVISADFDFTYACYVNGVLFKKLNQTIAICQLGGISCINSIRSYQDRISSFKKNGPKYGFCLMMINYPFFIIKSRLIVFLDKKRIMHLYRKLKYKYV